MKTLVIVSAIVALASQPCVAEPPAPPPPTEQTQEQVHAACIAASERSRTSAAQAMSESIVDAAEQEWGRFGGRSYTYKKHDYQYRTVEADWVELRDARFQRIEDGFTWGRVYSYWRSVNSTSILDFAYTLARNSDGSPKRDGEGQPVHVRTNLNSALGKMPTLPELDANQREALRIAAIRASLIERPWSAVFISTMMKVAGLTASDFPQTPLHADYMRAALARSRNGTGTIRFMACPPTRDVSVRPGDLICNGRENTPGGFDTLWNATSGFESHCDIVVSVDRTLTGFEIRSIGGNVQDTVLKTLYTSTGVPTLGNIVLGKRWLTVLLLI